MTTYERYFKDVYQIYLEAQLYNDGQFTIEQSARLKSIASTCVTEGGMIVYVARGFMSKLDLIDIQKTIEECEKIPVTTINRSNINYAQLLQAPFSTPKEAIVLYPNPSNESININLPNKVIGNADIFDITGRLLKSFNLINKDNLIHHELSNGIYIIKIKTSDGNTESIKLTIKK